MTIALRWGIVTAGKISHDFCVALSTLPFDEHQIVAVAARDKEKAEEFAEKHEIPKAFGSYCELAEWDIGEYKRKKKRKNERKRRKEFSND